MYVVARVTQLHAAQSAMVLANHLHGLCMASGVMLRCLHEEHTCQEGCGLSTATSTVLGDCALPSQSSSCCCTCCCTKKAQCRPYQIPPLTLSGMQCSFKEQLRQKGLVNGSGTRNLHGHCVHQCFRRSRPAFSIACSISRWPSFCRTVTQL